MIEPKHFVNALEKSGISFVTGVPDSLLKEICAFFSECFSKKNHIIATNEGSAIALAIGHYLATGHPGLVYMQNSGLGNIINPINSLADPLVYGIPMLLLIGWRGEVNQEGIQLHDEPQHVKQGLVTLEQLQLLDIPYLVIDQNSKIEDKITDLVKIAIDRNGPVAIVVRKNTFSPFKIKRNEVSVAFLRREEAIETILSCLPDNIPIVATTGKASRELFELRKSSGKGHYRDFLTVGGMGHASQIAAGIALSNENRKVVCIDGDGAMLMHMGALAVSAELDNFIHIVINNGTHDSVGGQPTKASLLDLSVFARDFGYKIVGTVYSKEDIIDELRKMVRSNESSFLEIKCKTGARSDLGRPTRTPAQNKGDFMLSLKCSE